MQNAALLVLSGFWLFTAGEKTWAYDDALKSLGKVMPKPNIVLTLVILVELLLGIGLWFLPTTCAVISLLLLGGYQVFDYKLFREKSEVVCYCFGKASTAVSTASFVINGAAMAISMIALGAASINEVRNPFFYPIASIAVAITLDQIGRLVLVQRAESAS